MTLHQTELTSLTFCPTCGRCYDTKALLKGGHNLFENLLPCNHNKGVTFFDVKNQVGKTVTSSDNLIDLYQMYNIKAEQETSTHITVKNNIHGTYDLYINGKCIRSVPMNVVSGFVEFINFKVDTIRLKEALDDDFND